METKKFLLTKSFAFDSAYKLTDYQQKCENLHEHTYKLEVTVGGAISESGMIVDFNDLNEVVEKNILEKLDHKYLNEVIPSETTCENLAQWIWNELEPYILLLNCKLEKITLFKTPDSRIELFRDK